MTNNLLGTAWGNQGPNTFTEDDLGYDLTLGGNNLQNNNELSDWEQSLIGDSSSKNQFDQPVNNILQDNSADNNLGNVGVPVNSQDIYAASLKGTNDGSGKSDWELSLEDDGTLGDKTNAWESSLEATDANQNPYKDAAKIWADRMNIKASSDDDDDDISVEDYNKGLVDKYEAQFRDDSTDEAEEVLDVDETTEAEDIGEAEDDEEEYQDEEEENYFESIAPKEYDFADLQHPDSLPEISQGLAGFFNPALRKQYEGLM